MFTRPMVMKDAQVNPARPGVGIPASFSPVTLSADSAQTLTVAQLSGGLIIRSGHTAGRTDTTPTAALILAANPEMDIGDNFTVLVSNTAAFAITFAGGTDVTMGTKTVMAASSLSALIFTKTSATTMTCTVL